METCGRHHSEAANIELSQSSFNWEPLDFLDKWFWEIPKYEQLPVWQIPFLILFLPALIYWSLFAVKKNSDWSWEHVVSHVNSVASLDPRVKSWKELGIGSSVSCLCLVRSSELGANWSFTNGSDPGHGGWQGMSFVETFRVKILGGGYQIYSLFSIPTWGKKTYLTWLISLSKWVESKPPSSFLWIPECHNLRVSSFDEVYKTEDQPPSWARKMSQVAKWRHFPHHCWV